MKKMLAFLLFCCLITLVGCGASPTTGQPPADPPVTDNTTPPASDENPSETPTNPGDGGNTETPENPDGGKDEPVTPQDPSVPPEPTMPTLPADAINAVTDWGISTASGMGISNGLTLYQKISSLSAGSTVFFPEGTYEVDLPMALNNKKDIRIVGYKAIFLNTRATNTVATQPSSEDASIPASLRTATATSGMVWIEGSQNITIEGITFRYACPTSISGRIINRTSSYIDVEITDGSYLTGNEYVMAINTHNASGATTGTLEQYAATNFPVEKRNETTLRVSGINTTPLTTGIRVSLRMSLSSNYIFTIFNSSDLTFRDLTLNNSLNGGFLIEHRTMNAAFERVRVQSHNPDALMSLNADALHIAGLGGTLTIKDCYFERGGDDFINVHAVAAKPTSVSGNSLTYTLSWGADTRWAARGDVIEFFHPTTFATLGTATIVGVSDATLTFDALPNGVDANTVLSNKSLHPSVSITDTHARYNRARAFLLQTDDITIKNCHFLSTRLAAILIAPDIDNWLEVGPARGVTISECTFENCGSGAAGTIQIASDHDNASKTYSTMIHTDITITHCTFVGNTAALSAVNCRRISFVDNFTAEATASRLLIFNTCDDVAYDAALKTKVAKTNTTNITERE